jgi:hypothetical protein
MFLTNRPSVVGGLPESVRGVPGFGEGVGVGLGDDVGVGDGVDVILFGGGVCAKFTDPTMNKQHTKTVRGIMSILAIGAV